MQYPRIDNIYHFIGDDTLLLSDIDSTQDASVLELMNTKKSLIVNFSKFNSNNNGSANISDSDKMKVYATLLRTIAEAGTLADDPLRMCGDLLNSSAVRGIIQRDKTNTTKAFFVTLANEIVRRSVRRRYEEFNKLPLQSSRSIKASYKVNEVGIGAVVLTNVSEKDLHWCAVSTCVKFDQTVIDRMQNNANRGAGEVKILGFLVGMNPNEAIAADRLKIAYHRLDQGYNAFVPFWERGSRLEIEVGRPDAILAAGNSVSVWIGHNDGTIRVPLDLDAFQDVLRLEGDGVTPVPGRRGNGRR